MSLAPTFLNHRLDIAGVQGYLHQALRAIGAEDQAVVFRVIVYPMAGVKSDRAFRLERGAAKVSRLGVAGADIGDEIL